MPVEAKSLRNVKKHKNKIFEINQKNPKLQPKLKNKFRNEQNYHLSTSLKYAISVFINQFFSQYYPLVEAKLLSAWNQSSSDL